MSIVFAEKKQPFSNFVSLLKMLAIANRTFEHFDYAALSTPRMSIKSLGINNAIDHQRYRQVLFRLPKIEFNSEKKSKQQFCYPKKT